MKEFLLVDAPHPSTIDEELLLRHCKLEFGRGTGPGGQRAQQSRHRLRDRARTNWSDGPRRRNAQTGRQPPGGAPSIAGSTGPRGTNLRPPRTLPAQCPLGKTASRTHVAGQPQALRISRPLGGGSGCDCGQTLGCRGYGGSSGHFHEPARPVASTRQSRIRSGQRGSTKYGIAPPALRGSSPILVA